MRVNYETINEACRLRRARRFDKRKKSDGVFDTYSTIDRLSCRDVPCANTHREDSAQNLFHARFKCAKKKIALARLSVTNTFDTAHKYFLSRSAQAEIVFFIATIKKMHCLEKIELCFFLSLILARE